MIGSALDSATEQLLHELKESPTDLAKLMVRVAPQRRTLVPISAAVIACWNKDDPDSWDRVRAWLMTRGLSTSSSPEPDRPAPILRPTAVCAWCRLLVLPIHSGCAAVSEKP